METSSDGEFTPRELICEEAWGEIWRAQRKDGKPVILVAYTTPEGDELFEEAVECLEKWRKCAEGTVAQHLLKINELNQGAIPYLLADDPGGPTIREMMNALEEEESSLPLETQGKFANSVAKAMTASETYGFDPIGFSPDTIFKNERDKDFPFQLLPVAPGTVCQAALLCGGRYFPPEMEGAPDPKKIHPDSYSLATIWVDIFRRDLESDFPENPIEQVPFEGLRFILQLCLKPEGGSYSDPNTVMMGIDRWVRKAMKEDIAEFREKELRRKRGPLVSYFVANWPVFKKIGSVGLLIGAIGLGGYFLLTSRMFDAPRRKQEPEDVVFMLFEDILNGGGSFLAEYGKSPTVRDQVNSMLAIIEDLEDSGQITKWNRYQTTVLGSGSNRTAKVDLIDNSEQRFARVLIPLRQGQNIEWSINGAHFELII